MVDLNQLISEHKGLKSTRLQWDSHWQDIADVLYTARADFTDEHTLGDRRNDVIYDAKPSRAHRQASASLHGLIKPSTAPWFGLKTRRKELMQDDEVKQWLAVVERRLRGAIYANKSQFIRASSEVDRDLVAFGTGVLFIGEREDLSGLLFRSYHLRNVHIGLNSDGIVDRIYLTNNLTPYQAAQRFGEENLSAEVRKVLSDEKSTEKDRTVEIVEVIKPAKEIDIDLPEGMVFASVTFEVKEKHKITDGGYYEFPFAVPRWETVSGEVYGRGPGEMALPDANTLQAMGETLLTAGQKIVHPPLLAASDTIIGHANTYPGGLTYFDASQVTSNRSRPIEPLDIGANLPIGREMQNDVRLSVDQAFFVDQLSLPDDGPQMTAAEVHARRAQFTRNLGPTFERIENDYTAVIVERCLAILLRAKVLPEAPDALRNQDVDIEYKSPASRIRSQADLAGFANAVELLLPLIQLDPTTADYINNDEIVKDLPDAFGHPPRYIKTDDMVAALREQRARAQQAQQAVEAAPVALQAAETINKLGGSAL